MIISGFQGIGKSTLARENYGFIDLESSAFWVTSDDIDRIPEDEMKRYDPVKANVDGKNKIRSNYWAIPYVHMAEYLSKGCDEKRERCVFVSSHLEVRILLRSSKERVFTIYPSLEIKDQWIERLRKRHQEFPTEKNLAALNFAIDHYDMAVADLMNEPVHGIEIKQVEYEPEDLMRWIADATGWNYPW